MNLYNLLINHPGRIEALQYSDNLCTAATPPSKGGESFDILFCLKTTLRLMAMPTTPLSSSSGQTRRRLKKFLNFFKSPLRVPIAIGIGVICILLILVLSSCSRTDLIISCRADNDLYITLSENKIKCTRYESPAEAVANAPKGSGILILADGYPRETTPVDSLLYAEALMKDLRLFVEYPSYIPGVVTGEPRGTHWERAVISSDAFAPELNKLRILAIHDCRFIPAEASDPDIVIARIAGFDSAVYGLPQKVYPVLFELPQADTYGPVLVSTTKLSQFITGRYSPADAWQAIWSHILKWAQPEIKSSDLKWNPEVKPSYSVDENLPPDAEREALKRGINWYFNSRMIVNREMMSLYDRPTNDPVPAMADPDISQDWPFGHRVGFMPGLNSPPGDGSLGVLEGFDAKIFFDGTQPVRWWRRGDCNGEIAGAISLAGLGLEDSVFLKTGANIGDWLFFKSMISLGERSDPDHPAYGLSGWNDVPAYCGPGTMNGYEVYYGDDNARVILGMMIAAAALNTDRYDRRLMNIILGNLRISGKYGFQPNRLDQAPLVNNGWKHYFKDTNISYSPHYQANIWACYLWAYKQTGFSLFLERAEQAISMIMSAYPDKWIWTNGIQQERAKMLLPLSWLVRVDDTQEHRNWLRTIAADLLEGQAECGAIREEIGEVGKGGFPPPESNEAYGTSETPLIQTNGNGVADMLYTVEFAFLGLHEAAAATGDDLYREAENKLAEFLCRIQIRSEKHPELDGGWFRAFDFYRWEYWASNGDAGWGAWSIESGWTQSWITSVLALRLLNTSVWELTGESKAEMHFDDLLKQMLPERNNN